MNAKPLAAAMIGVSALLTQLGCHACQSCHDYGSPVSGAVCGGGAQCRAGSMKMLGEVAPGAMASETVASEQTQVR